MYTLRECVLMFFCSTPATTVLYSTAALLKKSSVSCTFFYFRTVIKCDFKMSRINKVLLQIFGKNKMSSALSKISKVIKFNFLLIFNDIIV